MKKNALILKLLVLGIYLNAQVTNLHNDVCYTSTTREFIKIPLETDLYALTTDELLSTRQVITQQRFKEYFNSNSYYSTQYYYIYHVNKFPSWYLVPNKTIIDHEGVTNYFNSTSTLYEGGWSGHNYTPKSNNGHYVFDSRLNIGRYVTNYTSQEQSEYYELDKEIKKYSIIKTKTYKEPTQQELDNFMLLGYSVLNTTQIIEVKNSEIMFKWNKIKKSTQVVTYLNGNIESETEDKYQYHNTIGDYVLKSTTIKTPIILSTGDCAEKVEFETFSDYNLGCGNDDQFVLQRSSENLNAFDFNIYPNPAQDVIKLHLESDHLDEDTTIELMIFNSVGSTVYNKLLKIKDLIEIDIHDYPAGLYTMTIVKNNKFYSQNFIKN